MPISPDGPLAYGMQLPVQSQSAIYAEPWEAAATPPISSAQPAPPIGAASPTSPVAITSPFRAGWRTA